MKPKNPWFDAQCINSKRELNRLAASYGKNSNNDEFRTEYYQKRRDYKNLIKSKKSKFFYELSQDIAEENNISWSRFKKLKSMIMKTGKAVAEDCIANEFLKSTCPVIRATILHLFDECLRVGAYPWNTSLVTPLHKKGNLQDPNNYRAIAVASNIGKLFSSILLERLASFRNSNGPDTNNQLGFCKQAQTSDHVLTLSTCINKYVHHENKGRVYACFVDYAKAFDTVCREALLYKLWHLGIQGRFFRCLDYMYSNSSARVKLLNKLSEKIDILCGTEQGHPMSPELFKLFINDLSERLNNVCGISVPVLDETEVSHLLWADDL